MSLNQPLSLFVSSKMQELAEERHSIHSALKAYKIYGWLWEEDAGARPEPIRRTYLKEVEACDIYIGLFWLGYGPDTIEEYQHARNHNKPCLIYEKHINIEHRSPELANFLQNIQQVANPNGLTVCRFETSDQLAEQVQTDVLRLLTTRFRESRLQPQLQPPNMWNVPFHHNPFFTGRDSLIVQLHNNLASHKATALTQAEVLGGLGGIGKTQIALEYAYRFGNKYQAIFWLHADSHASLINDYFKLADLLNLPLEQKEDPDYIVAAVKHWFQTHESWLLIFDNAEELEMVSSFFPTRATGNILLTTRRQATGTIAQQIRVGNMTIDEGTLFLLRRAKFILLHTPVEQIDQADWQKAEEISHILSGLPLALDQAGAYIEETKCSLAEYLELYQKRRADLLARRGTVSSGHPDSVMTTFSLLYERVKKNNNGAVALLKLCAFLHADAIPMEIICSNGAPELTPELLSLARDPFERNRAIEELLQHSLLYRDTAANTLTIHRLVQAVIKDSMTLDEQRSWAQLAIQAVNHAFPLPGDYTAWPTCQRYLPHAQVCEELIEQWKLTSADAFHLLDKTAKYAFERGQFDEAEQLFQQLLMVQKSITGPEHPDINTLMIMNATAGIYGIRARYAEAEKLYLQMLRMCESVKDSVLVLASIYTGLGRVYEKQDKLAEAEQLHQWVLTFNLHSPSGQETLQVATCLNDLAIVYKKQGRFPEAEKLYLRSLAIRENLLESNDPSVSESLNNIAVLYNAQGKYSQAEEYCLRAHHIKEQIYAPDHPRMATSYDNLATVYEHQGKYSEACSYYQKEIEICERKLGPDHPQTKNAKTGYENLLKKMNEGTEFERKHDG